MEDLKPLLQDSLKRKLVMYRALLDYALATQKFMMEHFSCIGSEPCSEKYHATFIEMNTAVDILEEMNPSGSNKIQDFLKQQREYFGWDAQVMKLREEQSKNLK